MKELLRKIGITEAGYFSSNNNYVIDFDNSDEYNKAFSKLDRTDLVEENDDTSVINMSVSNIMYSNNDFSLNLIADFDNDTYKLVVTDLKEKN
nr:MAG TPA: hypothetical protein [Caudoviricetes sp.]